MMNEPSFTRGRKWTAGFNVVVALLSAFAIVVMINYLAARHSVRYTIVGSAVLLSAMIAWSRVMLGVHFPSDVTAGWLGGAGWAFLAAALLYRPARAAADSEVAKELDPANS